MEKRQDMFLHRFISEPQPELWAFLKSFCSSLMTRLQWRWGSPSIKKLRSAISSWTSSLVPLTPELQSSVAAARTTYRLHLENERRKKESEAKGLEGTSGAT
ncbi:hypothetical protein CRENBAI_009428 [Crenichthys baileyi]|uniref:Uncharacterized protein n=1 Tax=Crenichthys baileyi TaxID=28760 RepID=A0AAV9R226_9TELE